MEYDKINNLLRSEELGSAVDSESENLSKSVTREYVNTYNENKSVRFKTPMLRSNLCDYSDAYILVKGTITVNGIVNRVENEINKRHRPLILKNNASFVSCMTRINGELIEDADDLDIVMPMYNLFEYSKNYRKTIGSLYNYYRDELNDDANLNNFANNNVVSSNAFKYKTKITGNTYNIGAGEAGYDGIETKEQRGGFLGMRLETLGASLLGNLLTGGKGIMRAGDGIVRAGEGIVRAGEGSKKNP